MMVRSATQPAWRMRLVALAVAPLALRPRLSLGFALVASPSGGGADRAVQLCLYMALTRAWPARHTVPGRAHASNTSTKKK